MKMRRTSPAASFLLVAALAALEFGLLSAQMWSIRHFHPHFGSGAAFSNSFVVPGLLFGLCMLIAILLGRNIGMLAVQAASNQAYTPGTRIVFLAGADVAGLPKAESLTRALEKPAQIQADTILWASGETQGRPEEQLVRASEGHK